MDNDRVAFGDYFIIFAENTIIVHCQLPITGGSCDILGGNVWLCIVCGKNKVLKGV